LDDPQNNVLQINGFVGLENKCQSQKIIENRKNYTIYKKSNENINNSTVNQNDELIVDRNLFFSNHRPKSLLKKQI